MTTPIKYSFELLTKFCSEKDVKLVDDYSNEKLYSSTKINFFCTSCNKENVPRKTFRKQKNLTNDMDKVYGRLVKVKVKATGHFGKLLYRP